VFAADLEPSGAASSGQHVGLPTPVRPFC